MRAGTTGGLAGMVLACLGACRGGTAPETRSPVEPASSASTQAATTLVLAEAGPPDVMAAVSDGMPKLSPVLDDPVLHGAHRAGLEPAGAHPADLLGAHEPAALEHVEVPQHRWQRHPQGRCELAHRGGTTGEPIDDRAAVAVGQSVERLIELLGLSGRHSGHRSTILR